MSTSRRFPRSVCALALAGAAALGAARADDAKEGAGDARPAAPTKAELERDATERFSKLDRNNDGMLRASELPEGWADRFDQNGDGSVGRSEFVEVSSRPEKLRRLHPMRDARARAASTLASFDRNKDGLVQREEYPGRDDVFRRTDRNRDGALSPAELLTLCEDEIAEIRKTMRNPDRGDFLPVFDVDRDNRVGPEEYDGPAAPFRRFDTDGDGVVTYDELYPERMMAARDSAPKPEQRTALQELDKDGDGKVARAEFAGSDAAWRRLDTNGDGWITAADGR